MHWEFCEQSAMVNSHASGTFGEFSLNCWYCHYARKKWFERKSTSLTNLSISFTIDPDFWTKTSLLTIPTVSICVTSYVHCKGTKYFFFTVFYFHNNLISFCGITNCETWHPHFFHKVSALQHDICWKFNAYSSALCLWLLSWIPDFTLTLFFCLATQRTLLHRSPLCIFTSFVIASNLAIKAFLPLAHLFGSFSLLLPLYNLISS